MKLAFKDMPDGTHFTDGKRNFIKMQTILPAGTKASYKRLVDGVEVNQFNAVDYDGHSANCPDKVIFELI